MSFFHEEVEEVTDVPLNTVITGAAATSIVAADNVLTARAITVMDTKLDISSSVKAQNYLNTLSLTTESKSFVLVAKVVKNQRYQTKNTIQAEDE